MTSVSAVVVNWQGEDFLPACLDALQALEDAPAEILVVDNASTDGSLQLLAERYPAVRVISMERNAGPAAARNAGLAAARERWVLVLDNDVRVPPGLLAELLYAAKSMPSVAVVQPRSVFAADLGRVHYDGGRFHYVGLAALRNFHCPLIDAEGSGVVAVDVAISLCWLVNRDLLLAVGGFDERYFILYEDLDLSWRLRAAGHAILCAEDCVVQHDTGTPELSFRGGTDYPGRRVYFNTRNRGRFLFKNLRASTWFLTAPGLFLYEGLWFAFCITQGNFGAWCRGKWDHLRSLPELLRERREVQSQRRLGDRELLIGGPMTITPSLSRSGPARVLLHTVDRLLRGWFAVVRWALR